MRCQWYFTPILMSVGGVLPRTDLYAICSGNEIVRTGDKSCQARTSLSETESGGPGKRIAKKLSEVRVSEQWSEVSPLGQRMPGLFVGRSGTRDTYRSRGLTALDGPSETRESFN